MMWGEIEKTAAKVKVPISFNLHAHELKLEASKRKLVRRTTHERLKYEIR